jgi:hypothetical protein
MFWQFRRQTLSYVGFRAKRILKREFLSGQELDLKAYPRDKAGKRTVRYRAVPLRNYVEIASYPANLFEKGRMLRSGWMEKGKHIIKRKFKSRMKGQVDSIIADYDHMYLQKLINKFDK